PGACVRLAWHGWPTSRGNAMSSNGSAPAANSDFDAFEVLRNEGRAGLETAMAREVDERVARAVPRDEVMHDLVHHITKLTERHVALERAHVVLEKFVFEECLKNGGTWKPEQAFARGDVTTYGGRPWVCENGNKGSRPGENGDWRMMEK